MDTMKCPNCSMMIIPNGGLECPLCHTALFCSWCNMPIEAGEYRALVRTSDTGPFTQVHDEPCRAEVEKIQEYLEKACSTWADFRASMGGKGTLKITADTTNFHAGMNAVRADLGKGYGTDEEDHSEDGPWQTYPAICGNCGHTWQAVCPAGMAAPKRLECPECGYLDGHAVGEEDVAARGPVAPPPDDTGPMEPAPEITGLLAEQLKAMGLL